MRSSLEGCCSFFRPPWRDENEGWFCTLVETIQKMCSWYHMCDIFGYRLSLPWTLWLKETHEWDVLCIYAISSIPPSGLDGCWWYCLWGSVVLDTARAFDDSATNVLASNEVANRITTEDELKMTNRLTKEDDMEIINRLTKGDN